LGAEKALFRALKTRGKTPKYGLLFHSTFIGRAGSTNKGRISRFLANKCSIASRIDCFTETPNSVFGEKLREQVEERLKFYESGDVPRKNVDVMKEALDESMNLSLSMAAESKKKKKGKKRKLDDEEEVNGTKEETVEPVKKKKKKHQEDPLESSFYAGKVAEDIAEEIDNGDHQPKKKKKKKKQAADE